MMFVNARKLAKVVLLLCAVSCATVADGQPKPQALAAKMVSTPQVFGHPSLEGIWAAPFIMPMEASAQTPELVVPEARQREVAAAEVTAVIKFDDKMLDPNFPELMKDTDGLPLVRGQRRTRLVVLPADGKLPYTAAALKELNAPDEPEAIANPEDRPAAERCLVGYGQPPMTSFAYQNQMQIVQARDKVILHLEYSNDLRVIPLTDTHGPAAFRGQLGDSIAHWEGDTLVIETIGLPDNSRFRFFPIFLVPGESKVIERLTRISDSELLYQFTVVDPKVYAAPWLAEFSWHKSQKPMFESACHEGNYSLRGILAGARREERVKATKGVSISP